MAIGNEVLTKFRPAAEIFIETGSYEGKTIEKAVAMGFKKIYSIELAEVLFKLCKEKFIDNKEVEMIFGDSTLQLKLLLDKINEPCLFWLDSHYSWGQTAKGDVYCPLYQELDIIMAHPIKTHTILIDDVRLMSTEWKDIKIEILYEKLRQINPNYKFSFENGVIENDILVASL